jgi:hypothetical protein
VAGLAIETTSSTTQGVPSQASADSMEVSSLMVVIAASASSVHLDLPVDGWFAIGRGADIANVERESSTRLHV